MAAIHREHESRFFALHRRTIVVIILAMCALAQCNGVAGDELADGFAAPPVNARLRAYWWWLNSNVTKEAITKDLEWMKQIGMGGGLLFDAGGATQGGHAPVPAGPLYGSPEWRALFKHTLKEADRLGLEMSLSPQSGWNLGGPMVRPENAAKLLTWSETIIDGPANVTQRLAEPRKREDFYRDVAVVAFRLKSGAGGPQPVISASSTQPGKEAAAMLDGSADTFWVSRGNEVGQGPAAKRPEWVRLSFQQPVTLSGVRVLGRPGYGPRECEWQTSADGKEWKTVRAFTAENGRESAEKFAEVTGAEFRLLIRGSYDPKEPESPRNVQIAELTLLGKGGVPLLAARAARPIRDLQAKAAFHELGGSATDCSGLLDDVPAEPGEEDAAAKDVVDLTGRMDADGTLRWSPPEGRWLVLRFGYSNNGAHVSTSSGQWTGLVLDYLSADAMRWYWGKVVEPILAEGGPLVGKALKGIQTDSWELGGVNWTPGFAAEFRKRRGYDVLPFLPVLAGRIVDSRDASNRFLADFRRTIADLVHDNHYAVMAELARQRGLFIHPESGGPHAAPLDALQNLGLSEMPMSEFWVPSPHRPTEDKRFFVKQAACAAHIYGHRIVCAEGFTSIGPQWTDVLWSSQKPSFDHEACAGLNLVFWHAFTCSPKEMGLPGQEYFAGTHFNPQITWAKQAHGFVGYLNRSQFLLQQGTFVADVLYYYGNHVPNFVRRQQDDPARVLPQYDYDVVNEEVLLRAAAKDGRIALPGGPAGSGVNMTYRVLVLPNLKTMSLEVARKVRELALAGGVVIGPKPERTTGRQDDGELQRIADELWSGRVKAAETKNTLASLGVPPDVEGIPDWIHRRDGEADIYFVSWQKAEPGSAECTFRVGGKQPEIWDPVTGERRDAGAFTQKDGRTTVPLEFGPYGSLFVVFRKPVAGNGTGRNFRAYSKVGEVTGPWKVSFDPQWFYAGTDRNAGSGKREAGSGTREAESGKREAERGKRKAETEPVVFDKLISWTDRPEAAIKYYGGTATYRKTFDVPPHASRFTFLDLGAVHHIAQVRLNGQDLGVVWCPPWRVEITGVAKPVGNELEVEVVNGWANRIIGDATLPPQQRRTRTNIRTLTEKSPLIPSGLMGPVTIQAAD